MKNSEVIQKQIRFSKPVDQRFIDDASTSTHFTSGRKIEIGDKVLFAFLEGPIDENHSHFSLVRFSLDEYGTLYEDAFEESRSDYFPTLKFKKND